MKHLYTSWTAGLLSLILSGALTACNATSYSVSVKTPIVDSDKWTQITSFTRTYYCVAYGSGEWLAVDNSDATAYSVNGVSQTEITVGATNWFDAAYGNGEFVTVGNSDVAYNGGI